MDFNDMLDKAKNGFNVVCRKTEDAVNVSKLKLELTSIEAKLSKDYERLGKLCYNAKVNETEISDMALGNLLSDIGEKIKTIDELKAKIENVKNKKLCPVCNKYVDLKATFCSYCGERLD